MAAETELVGQLGGIAGTLVWGGFFLLVGGGIIAAIWYFKTQVAGYPYKVILEELRGRDVLTSLHRGRFEKVTTDEGERLVFMIKGFPQKLQQIDFSHIQSDNSIRLYRAGQNEFRPVKIDATSEGIGWLPLIDPSWERAHIATIERMVRMKADNNLLERYAWIVPLGVCLIFMLIVVVATLNGLNEVIAAMSGLASSLQAVNAQTASTAPAVIKDTAPVIFSLVV